jgi:hypothetical protein
MSPAAARAAVIALSVLVLGMSALLTVAVWHALSPLQLLPRAMLSLLAWVSAYYVAANLVFWKAVLRISTAPFPQQG